MGITAVSCSSHQRGDYTPKIARHRAFDAANTIVVYVVGNGWEILNLLRAFYAQFQLSPANRALVRYVAQQLGPDKGNSLYLNRLFKGTPAKLAAKLAGLPKPSNCL